MSKLKSLPSYQSGIAAALLLARESLMAPIRHHLRAHNITEQQWRVLRVLQESGSMDPTTLSRAAILHAPSVSRILRELVERELISREKDEADARRSLVYVTPKGDALVEATSKHTLQVINGIYESFGRERISGLVSELHDFVESVSQIKS